MKIGLELPREADEEAHLHELLEFMAAHGQVVALPEIFILAWLDGKFRLFSAREDGKLKGLAAVCLVQDPVTAGYHWWISFAIGQDLSAEIASAMWIYTEIEDEPRIRQSAIH